MLTKPPDPDQEREAREELEGFKRGGQGRVIAVPRRAASTCACPRATWTLKGSLTSTVRSRWGSKGRINLIGTLAIEGCTKHLEYRM